MGERRTVRVTATVGRDKGKIFELREMPADQGERWANRALVALANAGGKLPDGVMESGMAGLDLSFRSLVLTGLQALRGLSYREVEPLFDEMKPCMKWCPPGSAPLQDIFPGEASQIEEIATWWFLRFELFQLHVGFSLTVNAQTTDTTQSSPV